MKKIFKILLVILIPIILISSFFILHIFFYDPFIKLAPKNTFFYSYINLSKSNIFTKEFNNIMDDHKDIKNYIENSISKDNLYKINNYYNNKIAIFLSNDNNINLYIVFKKQSNKLLNENIDLDVGDFQNIINKYLGQNNKIKLCSRFLGDYFFITNNLDSLKNIDSEKYLFYTDYLYTLFKNRDFYNLISRSLVSGYININPIKDILEQNDINIFYKNYSVFSINYTDKKIEFKINNVNNLKSDMNDFDIYNLFKPNIIVDNFNITNFYKKLYTILTGNEITKNEALFFNKFLNYEDINIADIKRLFDNSSKIFLVFDHNINLNNIKNFLIITKLDDLNNYKNEISSLENIFLRQAGKNNLQSVSEIENGIILKEKVINTSNLKFEDMDIYNNNIRQHLQFLRFNNSAIYFSFIEEGEYFIISNSLNMINSLYYSQPNSNILEINDLEKTIFFRNAGNNLIIVF